MPSSPTGSHVLAITLTLKLVPRCEPQAELEHLGPCGLRPSHLEAFCQLLHLVEARIALNASPCQSLHCTHEIKTVERLSYISYSLPDMHLHRQTHARLRSGGSSQRFQHPRSTHVCSFFNRRPNGPNGLSRQQYEQAIGSLLQTAVASPAPTVEESAQTAAPEQISADHQNGHAALHVVKPEKPLDAAPVQPDDSTVVNSNPSQSTAEADVQDNAPQAAAADQKHAETAKKSKEAKLSAPELIVLDAAPEGSSTAEADTKAAAGVAEQPVAAKLLEQLEKAAGAVVQETRVLKPTKARTEPKTPSAKAKPVPQATTPRNLVFVTSEVSCRQGVGKHALRACSVCCEIVLAEGALWTVQ